MKKGGKKVFKQKRGIRLSYIQQGIVYFTCLNYKNEPADVRSGIIKLCREVAGEDYRALFDILTKDYVIIEGVARKNYITARRLCRYKEIFYERFKEIHPL